MAAPQSSSSQSLEHASDERSSLSNNPPINIDDVRPYFFELTCNLRVLGCQLRLEPPELDDLCLEKQVDARQTLLEECFKKEKITSWEQFVCVLEKPALAQEALAEKIRMKYGLRSPSTSSTNFHSPSASSETSNTGKIKLWDTVNVIMAVTNKELELLGSNLELDPVRVKEVLSYYEVNEQHQRLAELWFRKEVNPTWEKVRHSLLILNRRESSNSIFSVPNTPTSPTDSMISSNEEEIKSRFACLLISVQSALKINHVEVSDVHQLLLTMFRPEECIPKTNLSDIFNAVTTKNLWNHHHHSPVEKVIKRFIPDQLSLITEYKDHLSGFYTTTKLIEYIASKNLEPDMEIDSDDELNLTTQHYQKLTVRLNIGRRISDYSMAYVRDLWVSFAEEFNIPSLTVVIDKILEGSLEIVWLVLPHVAEMIAASAHKSVSFFRRHGIVYVAIDDCAIHNTQLMEEQEDNVKMNTDSSVIETENLEKSLSLLPDLDHTPTHKSESGNALLPSLLSQKNDTKLQVQEFKERLTELQARAKDELQTRNNNVKAVYVKLQKVLPPRMEKEFSKYIIATRGGHHWNNFEEFFDDLSDFRWNCFEFELLQFVIKSNNCHASLKNAIDEYAKDVKHFKHRTTAASFIEHGQALLMRKPLRKGYKKLKTVHLVNADDFTIDKIDHFNEELWSSDGKLYECTFHICGIRQSSVEVEWVFPEEFSYSLVAVVCSEEGKTILEQHHISDMFIDDTPINPTLFLIEAIACEDWIGIDQLLEDEHKYIDLNYSKQVNGWTPLFHLAARGMVDLVQKMLSLGANPNIRDTDGKTPLMVAVETGNVAVVEAFLKQPNIQCQVNCQENVHGWSVLHIAAEKGFMDIFEMLSDPTYEVNTSLQDKYGRTALQIAEERESLLTGSQASKREHISSHSEFEETTETEQSIASAVPTADSGEEPITSKEGTEIGQVRRKGWLRKLRDWWDRNRREIRLTRAVISGSLPDVQKALNNRANPNRIINRMTQRTPLLEACQRGHTEVAKLLLKKGANPNWRAAEDWNALVLASRYGHVETVELLLSCDPSCREIINVKAGYYGWTPLHTTCYYNSYELVFLKDDFLKRLERVAKLLLENGADATITDRNGETPLTYASDKGYARLAELLIEKTPEEKRDNLINYQKKDSWTALLLASKQGHSKIVKSLLDAGASMTDTNKSKMTALHLGVSGGHIEVVEELASRADPSAINAVDKHGFTPLILATKLKNIKLIEVLHDHGADVNIKTKEKKTALMYAAKLNSIAVINLLLQYKADLFATDSNQQTARTLATDKEVQKHLDKLIREKQMQERIRSESATVA